MLQEAAGTLQVNQKSKYCCEIKPVQEKNVKYIFQKSTTIFCLKLQKKKHVPQSFMGELLKKGYKKAEKKDLHVKN